MMTIDDRRFLSFFGVNVKSESASRLLLTVRELMMIVGYDELNGKLLRGQYRLV
jgi:hypothetical protein